MHHSNDLLYVFPYPPGEPKLNEADTKVAKLMVDLWTSFATTGVPSSELAGVQWKPMKGRFADFHKEIGLIFPNNCRLRWTVPSHQPGTTHWLKLLRGVLRLQRRQEEIPEINFNWNIFRKFYDNTILEIKSNEISNIT